MLTGLIAGGLSALGSTIGGIYGANSSREASRWNTQQQLAWEREKFAKETELSNTEIQRRAADLEKAGINKIFATSDGASIPTAGSITPQIPDTSGYQKAGESIGNVLLSAINSAQQIQRTSEEISQIKAQTSNLDADSKLKGLQAISESYRKGLITAQTAKMLSETEINKLKYTSDKRWLDWERGSNIFKNISMPIISAIGAFGSLTKLGEIGKIFKKMNNSGQQGNIYNYYNNFSQL